MTLDELRAKLSKLDHLPGDTIVVLAKDAEGNGHSPLNSAEEGIYFAETTWSGEHYLTEEQRLAKTDPDDWASAPWGGCTRRLPLADELTAPASKARPVWVRVFGVYGRRPANAPSVSQIAHTVFTLRSHRICSPST